MPAPNFKIEKSLWKKGLTNIAGVDEVGRGSWAGPVVAAAVVLPKNFKAPIGFNESKKVSPNNRLKFSKIIKEHALSYSISKIDVSVINKFGIGKATQMAFRKAIRNLFLKIDFVIIDAFYINHFARKNQQAIKKGDEISISIAAASIIAKVYRDEIMQKLTSIMPGYGFDKHKGYGTKSHQSAILKQGLSRFHRSSFNLRFLAN